VVVGRDSRGEKPLHAQAVSAKRQSALLVVGRDLAGSVELESVGVGAKEHRRDD
jgi:hypothetical protein